MRTFWLTSWRRAARALMVIGTSVAFGCGGSGGSTGGVGGSDSGSAGTVRNVTHADGSTGRVGRFTAGAPLYADRPSGSSPQVFVATPFPDGFEGKDYILTRNGDKQENEPNAVNFELTTDATVAVLFDSRVPVPAWLNDGSWVATGETVTTTDAGSPARQVYTRAFGPGPVSLGGNGADSGSSSMYTVVAAPVTSASCRIVAPGPVVVGAGADFRAASVGGGERYSWSFGDGTPTTSPSTSPTASHVYASPGRYAVLLRVSNDLGSSSCALTQIVHHPLIAQPPVHSSTIVYSDGAAYAVNADSDTVTAIDGLTLEKIWEAEVGRHPRTLAAAPNGDLWVVNQDDATISVLDPLDGDLLDEHALPRASQPYGIAFDADGMAYVTLQGTGELIRLSASGVVTGALAVGHKPRGIAISGQRILVTQFVSTDRVGRVREVNRATFDVARTFEIAFDPGPDNEAAGRGVPNYMTSLTISPDGRHAVVPSKKDNVARGMFRDGQMLTFESMIRAIVSRVDLLDNHEDLAARLDLNDRSMPQAAIFSPVGDVLFVSTQGTNTVEFIDVYNGSPLGSVETGLAPQGLVLNDDATRLFVHNFMGRSVSVYDVRDLIAARNNAAPLLAEVGTVAVERLTPEELLGKRVFYNAADLRMSRDKYISCSGCHLDGDNDGQVWDFTQVGEGFRNTITLLGRAGMGHGLVHWTANFDEIQDFENDIRHFAGGTGFMSDADFDATSDPLGAPKAGLSAELDALAAFVASLGTIPASPYRNPDGSLTANGLLGKAVFADQGCAACHDPETNFTDGQRHDVGTIEPHSGAGHGAPLTGIGFDTPTLRGVWATAPYLHDGSAATLADVLDDPVHVGPLDETQKGRLVDYLLQIDASDDE